MTARPMIRIRNYALPVPEASGLPPCLLQVTRLPSQTMLWVGSIMGNAKLASDWSAAMPGFGDHPMPNATSLSRTTNNDISFSMSKRLSRRLKQPVFLSIDLPFLSADATGVSSEMSGRWLLLIEKLVIQKLDQDCQSEDEGTEDDLPERAKKISLDGEMVGR